MDKIQGIAAKLKHQQTIELSVFYEKLGVDKPHGASGKVEATDFR